MTDPNQQCVKCGETRAAIRKHEMICGREDPQTGELAEEFGRHRFKPWAQSTLDKWARAARLEEEHWKKIMEDDTDESWTKWKRENGLADMRS